ncbi:MAG: peptide chain release factor N(5)-glutamine methyltransferase [Aridibacter sp.]
MANISQAIEKANKILKNNGIAEPIREAKSILSVVLEKDKSFIIAHTEYKLTLAEENKFWSFIKRRANREPFQHIAGKQEFWGLDFIVTPDVLIPRPETELIVEAGVEILRDLENPNFCEIGIGSGCISVSILHEVKNARAYGLDISEKALQIAELNAKENGVSDRLNLMISDVFGELDKNEQFDLIVSNPPYVPIDDLQNLQVEVKDFDPHIALTDGKDGLSIIRKIIETSPEFLKPDGFLILEIGFNQSAKVRQMFDLQIWQEVDFFSDLQGIPRMLKAKISEYI